MSSLLTVETWNEYFLCCFLLNKKKNYIFHFSRDVSIFATDLTDNWNYIELLSCNSVRCRNTHSTHTSSALSVSLSLSLFFVCSHTCSYILLSSFFSLLLVLFLLVAIQFFFFRRLTQSHDIGCASIWEWSRNITTSFGSFMNQFALLPYDSNGMHHHYFYVSLSLLTHSLTRVVRSIFLTRFLLSPIKRARAFFFFFDSSMGWIVKRYIHESTIWWNKLWITIPRKIPHLSSESIKRENFFTLSTCSAVDARLIHWMKGRKKNYKLRISILPKWLHTASCRDDELRMECLGLL